MDAVLGAFWELSVDMGVYILGGLLAAGVLHQLIDEQWVRRHLGYNRRGAVWKGALFGTPLPLCSCSVIPFAAALRRSGASKGATLSFLVSAPITGVDSILATFGMFGWAFTLYRLITSVILAIVTGVLMEYSDVPDTPRQPLFSVAPSPMAETAVLSPGQPLASTKKPFSVREVFSYGFGTLLGSFSKSLLWGLVIGAVIAAAIPGNFQELLGENRWAGYLIAVGIAVPMYVCATASLPIAASLIVAGVSPGAAFIFLSAGPATNTVTMGVVKSMLGMRALVIYLLVIIGGSLLFGVVIDMGLDILAVNVSVEMEERHGWIEQSAAAVLLGLLAWHLVVERFRKPKGCCNSGSCCS